MPLVALIALVNLLTAFVRVRSRKAREAKPKSLWRTVRLRTFNTPQTDAGRLPALTTVACVRLP